MLNSFCFFCLGDLTIQLKVLLITMLLDYVSGVISAIYNKKLSSRSQGSYGDAALFCHHNGTNLLDCGSHF